MGAALWVLTFAAILAIALVVVRTMSARLADEPAVAIYDLPEAVDYVAARLPTEVTARLSFDDVRAVLEARLDLLEAAGAAYPHGATSPVPDADVVVEDDHVVALVLGRLGARPDVLDEDVALVLAIEASYVRAIGAVGGQARQDMRPGG
jgi:hypothetical protein